jgi:hypothetical protein
MKIAMLRNIVTVVLDYDDHDRHRVRKRKWGGWDG